LSALDSSGRPQNARIYLPVGVVSQDNCRQPAKAQIAALLVLSGV